MTEEVNTIETKYLQHLEANAAFGVYSAFIYNFSALRCTRLPPQKKNYVLVTALSFFSNIVEYVQLVNSNLIQKANANGKVTWYT